MRKEEDKGKQIPADFPRAGTASSVSGAQPKLLARLINGKYLVGPTNEELRARWLYCNDLAEQLAERTRRKKAAGLAYDLEAFYAETERRVLLQGWDVTPEEVAWMMRRVRTFVSDEAG